MILSLLLLVTKILRISCLQIKVNKLINTFNQSDYPDMYSSNVYTYNGSVDFPSVEGETYYAEITFYAEYYGDSTTATFTTLPYTA